MANLLPVAVLIACALFSISTLKQTEMGTCQYQEFLLYTRAMFRHANMSQIRKLALLLAQVIIHAFFGMLLLDRGYQYLVVNFLQGIQLTYKEVYRYALSKGTTVSAIDVEEAANPLNNHERDSLFKVSKHSNQTRGDDVLLYNNQNGNLAAISGNNLNLFAFPSEYNFSGDKFNLSLVKLIKEGKFMDLSSQQQLTYIVAYKAVLDKGQWMVLIDAAKGCITEPPNLILYPADFVVCSFYKDCLNLMGKKEMGTANFQR